MNMKQILATATGQLIGTSIGLYLGVCIIAKFQSSYEGTVTHIQQEAYTSRFGYDATYNGSKPNNKYVDGKFFYIDTDGDGWADNGAFRELKPNNTEINVGDKVKVSTPFLLFICNRDRIRILR
jgi:hypothetical protein